ncbi:hypothetical protein WJX84_009661, partial [Apatococcus fuscideae]
PPETVAPPGSADGALHSVATTAAERQGHSDQPLTAEIEARYETEEKVALWLLDTYNTAIKKPLSCQNIHPVRCKCACKLLMRRWTASKTS